MIRSFSSRANPIVEALISGSSLAVLPERRYSVLQLEWASIGSQRWADASTRDS
jgi:hypothetical protein